MVAEQEGQRPTRADGQARCTREIVFRDNRVLHFVVIANIICGHAVNDGSDLFAIGVVVEIGRRRAVDGDKVILRIVIQCEVVNVRVLLETFGQVSARSQTPAEQGSKYCYYPNEAYYEY
jgi:hypothetical protein